VRLHLLVTAALLPDVRVSPFEKKSTRNSKQLLVEWEQRRLQLEARSLVVLNPHVKGNYVFLGRGESLIF